MGDSTYLEKPRLFKPTPEQRKDLKIRRIWGEDYASNVELYDRLQSEAATRQSERSEKREATDGKAAAKETPEERRAKAKAQTEIFAKRLYRWKIAWLQPEQIDDLARELAIDVKREWKLTREFLELHNKAQLAKLIDEWYVPALNHASKGVEKRGELIDVILRHVPLNCPKEVLEAKRVRLA